MDTQSCLQWAFQVTAKGCIISAATARKKDFATVITQTPGEKNGPVVLSD
jgi:hypothetical protein